MEQLQTISLKSVYPMVKDGGISAVFNVQLFRLFQSVQFVQKRSERSICPQLVRRRHPAWADCM